MKKWMKVSNFQLYTFYQSIPQHRNFPRVVRIVKADNNIAYSFLFHPPAHTHTHTEPIEAPPSTPEPNEEEITLVLPQQTHTICDRKELQGRQERQRDGIWRQPSITDNRNSRETCSPSSNNSPAVVGSAAARGGDETTRMDGCKLQYYASGTLVRNITPKLQLF